MKRLIATLAILLMFTGTSWGQCCNERVETQVVSILEIALGENSADLGEVDCGDSALILWYVVEAPDADDYDIHFFTQDNAAWDATTDTGVDTDEMIYQVEGITTAYFYDDIIFPYTSTNNLGKMYIGISNTGTASTFNVRVFWSPRDGVNHAADTGN